jgi:glycosyltransferase involved in cell wall biosynthesis
MRVEGRATGGPTGHGWEGRNGTTMRFPPRIHQERMGVSVVVPCYNYADFLETSILSALNQRDVDVDVTVVDDASEDASFAIATRIASADPRVRVFRHDVNQGHLRTANEALGHAAAEYVVKLDADDLLTPGSLARSGAVLAAHPEVGFVYGYPRQFSGPVPRIDDCEPSSWTVWSSEAWLSKVLRRAHNVIMQPEVMIRRSALYDVGAWYSERLPWAEDYHLWLRLATHWSVGRVNGCVQGLYRVHPGSLQRSAEDLHLADLRARVDAVRLYVADPEVGARRANVALGALARDTKRLLAARRDDQGTSRTTLEEYSLIIEQLEVVAGEQPGRSPTTWRGPLGRFARRWFDAWRWRRWRATGV